MSSQTPPPAAPTDTPWLDIYPKNIAWDTVITPRPVDTLLRDTAQTHGPKPAFDFLGKCYDWATIDALVDKMARGLQDFGVKKGTHVGLFLPNCPYFLISYYAVLRAGGTVVNFNPLYVAQEIINQIEDSETDIMITLDLAALYDKMKEVMPQTRLQKLILCSFTDILPFPKNSLFRLAKHKELAEPDPVATPFVWFDELIETNKTPAPVDILPHEDIAVIQYTGGTTGTPKGAMLTHENVYANVIQAALWFSKAQPGQEKMLGVLPFFHVFAMTAVMNLSVYYGFEIIATPRFELKQTLKIIEKKKPQYFPAVPAIYSAINHYKDIDNYDLTSLRYCISGGAPLPVEVKKEFEEKTGCIVVEGYGLTESSPVACVNPLDGENRAGSIGLPLPATTIRITSREDGKTALPPGKRGELCIKGPQVMKGYWKNPEETANVLKDGYLHTGDVGIMDEDGYVRIVDRIKDLIITNGYNVYPRKVEDAIYQHPDVEECIVAGIPDEARGELIKAWIKPKDGKTITIEEMKRFLADYLSKIEQPRRYELREQPLPKTMIGKLSRKAVLEEEAEKTARS